MSIGFSTFAADVKRLDRALAALEPTAAAVGVGPPMGQEWFELLRGKLCPQLETEPLLVVAIVGGTNIGKSVVFNHLAGQDASAVSPLAAGTKHPVCLIPPGVEDPAVLSRLFESFELRAWQSADDPLREAPENRLFWRAGPQMPPRLLLLDAPDVDSDVTVNWERARALRQAADVLVAVLTQQKYNDAAVKQFFRAAVDADKPIVVVFNQCDLEADAEYWPQWLATFCDETGARPELVYVVPYDRPAAESRQLPFYKVGPKGQASLDEPSNLRDELGSLHFDAIKIRTFRGAMARVLDAEQGVDAYLEKVRRASEEFSAAATALSANEMARVAWPSLPASVLVEEIRNWWDSGRANWSRGVHRFYRTLGRGVTWPVRTAWQSMAGPQVEPLVVFGQQEREAIISAVEKMVDELDRLARVGNETLRPRLMQRLGGDARAKLLEQVQAAHQELPAVDDDYRGFLRAELDAWREANPRAVRFLRSLDHVWAVARPTITVALVVSSWGLAGGLVGPAGHAATDLATEAAIAGGITGGGEAIVSTTSEGVHQAAARLFGRLQSRYAEQRANWLAAWLESELLGDLLIELRRGAEAPQSAAFAEVEAAIEQLRTA
ncbi:MAG: GTPase [Thermoguttaceae bacterium]